MSRNAFLGTSEFAAAVLHRLADSPHRPVLAVAPPDRRKGRGRKLSPPPVAAAARELEMELVQTADVNDPAALDRVRAAAPELVTLCAFGQLIGEPLLSELPMINVHPSLLPRWRGAAPIERAIMARDADTGVSVMEVTAKLDSGPIALQETTEIGPDEDFGSLWPRLATIGGELLVAALDLRDTGDLQLREQDDAGATYAEKIEPAERRLDVSRPAAELAARVRALTPHIGAHLDLEGGGRLGVREARAGEGELQPGRLEASAGELLLGCGEGILHLKRVQPPGGRPMQVGDFLRGHGVPARAL